MYRIMDGLKNSQHRSTTAAVYHNIWKNFNKFVIRLDYKPTTWEERVALYCAFLVDKGAQSATIKTYISGIKKILEIDGYVWDNEKVAFSSLTRACRLVNDRVKSRLPIQRSLLEMLLIETIKFFHKQLYLQLLYKCLLTVGYFGLMCIGELATGTHPVKARDIYVSKPKQKCKIYLYTSKTHGRESRPQVITIEGDLNMENDTFFNPYNIIQEFLQMRGDYTNDNDPLFIFRDGSPVKPANVRNLLRKLLRRLNLNHKLYDTHSLRIGRATDLLKMGYSVQQIKLLGRWRSNAVFKYLHL